MKLKIVAYGGKYVDESGTTWTIWARDAGFGEEPICTICEHKFADGEAFYSNGVKLVCKKHVTITNPNGPYPYQ